MWIGYNILKSLFGELLIAMTRAMVARCPMLAFFFLFLFFSYSTHLTKIQFRTNVKVSRCIFRFFFQASTTKLHQFVDHSDHVSLTCEFIQCPLSLCHWSSWICGERPNMSGRILISWFFFIPIWQTTRSGRVSRYNLKFEQFIQTMLYPNAKVVAHIRGLYLHFNIMSLPLFNC